MVRHLNTAAVVTTFCPQPLLLSKLERIASQVKTVIVVDDTGAGEDSAMLDFLKIENIIYLQNKNNQGIAASLNRGIDLADVMGHGWVVTLDDDSVVSWDYLDYIFDFLDKREVLAMGIIACSRAAGSKKAVIEDGFRIKRNLITSGCVFEVKIYREAGGFDEGLFIDLVDFDFCARVRKMGHVIVQLNKIGMEHKVGNSREAWFAGTRLNIYNHAPFRLYYQMRNIFLFARNYFSFDPLLCGYLLLDIFRLPFKALLFEDGKRSRVSYLWNGLKDGLRGKRGRLAVNVERRLQ